MKKVLSYIFCFFCFALISCENQSKINSQQQTTTTERVTIYAAASLVDSVNDICRNFEQKFPGLRTEVNIGSSAQLAKQIEHGAPADVYMAANVMWMEYLKKRGLISPKTQLEPLTNRLVVVTHINNQLNLQSINDLTTDKVKYFAIADPGSVPAGIYSKLALKKANIWQEMVPKLTIGSDVRVAMAYVERKEADCGIVYFTDAKMSKKVKPLFYLPENIQPEIKYSFGMVKNTSNIQGTVMFIDYLRSDAAKKVFEKYGFKWTF